ncbi:MAG: Bug family tripartite tricarboxylate transporter substrate binding protein [Lautropia sp.]
MDRRTFVIGAAATAAWTSAAVAADPIFTRPIKVVVPAGPGGFTDIIARYIGQELTPRVGHSVVVENRGGAGGVIGAVAVAQSPADGYTLAMGNNNTHAMNVGLYKKLPYDPVKDFAPIAFVGSAPTVLVVHPSSPYRSVADLIADAKAKPGRLTYGSGGTGASSHMAAELLRQRAGIDIIHVPFKGNAPATQALLGSQVDFMFDTLPSVQPLAAAGRLRPLAGTALSRIEGLDVPAMSESLPGFEVTAWVALFAPAGTPQPMIDALDRDLTALLSQPAVATRLKALGATPQIRRPAELAQFVSAEIQKWNEVIGKAGIEPQ